MKNKSKSFTLFLRRSRLLQKPVLGECNISRGQVCENLNLRSGASLIARSWKICKILVELQKDTRSISNSITDHVQQHQHTAASIANAELTIDKINARLEMLALQQPVSQDRDGVVTRTSISFSLIPLALKIEKVTIQGKNCVEDAPSAEPTRIVRLPLWFIQRQYASQLRRATAGWLFSWPVHRIVPYDCSLFEACRIGDIDSIRTLLSTREASPFDRTASNATALQFAMESGQLEVCRLLRQAGILS